MYKLIQFHIGGAESSRNEQMIRNTVAVHGFFGIMEIFCLSYIFFTTFCTLMDSLTDFQRTFGYLKWLEDMQIVWILLQPRFEFLLISEKVHDFQQTKFYSNLLRKLQADSDLSERSNEVCLQSSCITVVRCYASTIWPGISCLQ